MQTLLEALEANSLEHKLEIQIKAALDSEQMNETITITDSLALTKKLNTKIFRSMPREWEMKKVNDIFLRCFKIPFSEIEKLNYTIVTQTFFNKNFKYLDSAGHLIWDEYGGNVHIGFWNVTMVGPIFGTYNIPNTTKKVIFSNVKELDLSKLH